MKAVYVKEWKRYSLAELTELLDADAARVTVVLRRLKEYGILKAVSSAAAREDLTELLEEELIAVSDLGWDDQYCFAFVGLVIIEGYVFKCFPKYLPENRELPEKLAQVLSVLEKYNAREQVVRLFHDTYDKNHFNLLSVMIFLLRDYFENRSYSNSREILETNGAGEVNWDRTINENFAIIYDGQPVYVEMKTRKRLDDERDFFRRLHECVLTRFSRELQEADLLTLLGIPGVELSEESLESFGETEYLLYRIEAELSQQFVARKQLVLKALHAYISRKMTLGDADGFSTFGSNSFHTVWEKACAQVIGSDLAAPISSLPLPLQIQAGYDKEATLLSLIEKPAWTGLDDVGSFTHHANKTLVPDLATFVSSGTRTELVILDAKYYVIQLERGKGLVGQPSVGDLTKQYLYQLAFREFTNAHGIQVVKNCFLIPTNEPEIVDLGRASLSMLNQLGLQDIQLRLLPADRIYDLYLREKHLSISELRL